MKYFEPPEEIPMPEVVRDYMNGEPLWKIASYHGITEKAITNAVSKYYEQTSRKLIFVLAERNVRVLLKQMNIKTPNE